MSTATTRRDELKLRCADLADRYGHGSDKLSVGLEYFAAHLFAQVEGYDFAILEGAPTEDVDSSEYVCGGKDDLSIDILLHDATNRQTAVIQTTWVSKLRDDVVEKAAAFFNRLPRWLDDKEVDKGNEKVRGLLIDAELEPEQNGISLYFVINVPIGDAHKLRRVAEEAQDAYDARGWNVECRVFGPAELESLRVELSNARSASVVPEVPFHISARAQFVFEQDPRVLVCAIKGNEIAGVYHRAGVKNKLFNANIRLALTSGKINPNIQATARSSDEGSNFFYFNNGITATCSHFDVEDGVVTATNMQVVNGAQTVNALQRALKPNPNPSVYVLLRLIETGQEYRNKSSFAENVTRYQNTQNPVRLSDFFSNDSIQSWLRDNLAAKLSGKGPIPAFYYVHKRGYKPSRSAGKALTLEELGYLRHAMLYGPIPSYGDTKSFWDKTSEGGRYWEAFGLEGQACDSWTNADTATVGWAVTTWMSLRDAHAKMRAQVRADPNRPVSSEAGYLGYLARYVTALAYVGLQQAVRLEHFGSVEELTQTRALYTRYSEPVVLKARELVGDEMRARGRTTQANPRLNLARDAETWAGLRDALTDKVTSGYVDFR